VSGIVLLAGEPEYEPQLTMPPLLREIADDLGVALEVRTPDVIEDTPEFPRSTFGDLGVLDDAELLVIVTRFRNLADDELDRIAAYLERGGAVIGVRTSSHAFHPDPRSSRAAWAADFGRDVLGSPWIEHHGHSSSTDVTAVRPASPLLDGVPDAFHARSWLYLVDPAPWAEPILHGVPVDPETDPVPGPVAWYGINDGRRTFYTSLGHPEDVAAAPFRRLLRNASSWALDR